MQRIGPAERRARLGVRHRLAPAHRADDVAETARSVVALHGTDPTSVYLSAWARLREPTLTAIDRALHEDRVLLRMLAMRRTVFVVPVEDAPILHAAASIAVARTERRRTEQLVTILGEDDIEGWLRQAESAALAALEERGEATAQELAKAVPALQRRVRVNVGKRYEGEIGMSSRILLGLAVEGRIVRGRPRGSWTSSQYRWVPVERWLGAALPLLPVEVAQAELVRRWLERFGPGTEADIRWWTGLTAAAVRQALATIGTSCVEIDGEPGHVLEDDVATTTEVEPWVALLPALDPTTMGWKQRRWYLGDHAQSLFDSTGNAGPTIWSSGRIIGGWAVRRSGEVVTRLLEDAGREVERAVVEEAGRLGAWLQSAPVVPRFSTPLQKELAG